MNTTSELLNTPFLILRCMLLCNIMIKTFVTCRLCCCWQPFVALEISFIYMTTTIAWSMLIYTFVSITKSLPDNGFTEWLISIWMLVCKVLSSIDITIGSYNVNLVYKSFSCLSSLALHLHWPSATELIIRVRSASLIQRGSLFGISQVVLTFRLWLKRSLWSIHNLNRFWVPLGTNSSWLPTGLL